MKLNNRELIKLPGELIRDIDRLPVSDRTLSLIKELDERIDMPVLFWIDYPGSISHTGRQPGIHNQYMVTVSHQEEQSEFERILLHHMLRGVMQTNRFPNLNGQPHYIQSIANTPLNNTMWHLCEKINAWVTTEFCRAHFKPYGIVTSRLTWERGIERLNNQAKWIPTMNLRNPKTISFLLEVSSIAGVSSEYMRSASRIIDKTSKRNSRILKAKMIEIVGIIRMISENYSSQKSEELMATVLKEIMSAFSLEDKFLIEYQYAMQKKYPMVKGVDRIYSFVPESIEDKSFYVFAVKQINTSLVLLLEYLKNFEPEKAYDFHVNLADGEIAQAYADGDIKSGYHIVATKTILLKLREYEKTTAIPQSVFEIGLDNEDSFRKRLFKCLVMGVFFHEYGHIYNGDCDDHDRLPEAEKEDEADEFAASIFEKCCILQYQPSVKPPEEEMTLICKKLRLDRIAFSIAQEKLKELRASFSA